VTRVRLSRIFWIGATAALAGLAATLSVVGIWSEPSADVYVKLVAAVWILTALGYFLVPVVQRSRSAEAKSELRVLGVLDDVELVASRKDVDGVTVNPPARGERLVLRRRTWAESAAREGVRQ
jgi:hypothetical protein